MKLHFQSKRKRLLEGESVTDMPEDENTRLFRPPRARTAEWAVAAATIDVTRNKPGPPQADESYNDDEDERQRTVKVSRVSPVVNLLANVSDGATVGHGIAHDTRRVRLGVFLRIYLFILLGSAHRFLTGRPVPFIQVSLSPFCGQG